MTYHILKNGEIVTSLVPGILAGNASGKVFGKLNCKAGMRLRKDNRVFFHSLEDAVNEGYRPCKACKPISEEDFETIKHLVPYVTLQEFYDRDKKR